MTRPPHINVALERDDAPEAQTLKAQWDDRMPPKPGDTVELVWSTDTPKGWENGSYRVDAVRAAVLDAQPDRMTMQPANLTLCLRLL